MASQSKLVEKRLPPLRTEQIPYIRSFRGNRVTRYSIESTLDPETRAELRDDDQESIETLLRVIQ